MQEYRPSGESATKHPVWRVQSCGVLIQCLSRQKIGAWFRSSRGPAILPSGWVPFSFDRVCVCECVFSLACNVSCSVFYVLSDGLIRLVCTVRNEASNNWQLASVKSESDYIRTTKRGGCAIYPVRCVCFRLVLCTASPNEVLIGHQTVIGDECVKSPLG